MNAWDKSKITEPVSILMPVCNEATVIEGVIEEWVRDVIEHLPEGSEFIFDEAASTDGTREILARMCDKYPFIRVMYNERKDGFANATRRLYAAARCPLVFFTDSDGQYVATDFWKLAKFMDRFEVVHGVKLGRKDPLFRRFFSMVFNKAVFFLYQMPYIDINSAYRLMRREVVEAILPKLNVMPTLINAEFLIRAEVENFTIKQVYVTHRFRSDGASRGLPTQRYFLEGLKAFRGLFDIKAEYRR
jgi:glycosyltransferase involved in cell wall biosynthesis